MRSISSTHVEVRRIPNVNVWNNFCCKFRTAFRNEKARELAVQTEERASTHELPSPHRTQSPPNVAATALDPVAVAARHSLSTQVFATTSPHTPPSSPSLPSTPRSSNGSPSSDGTLVGSPSQPASPVSPTFRLGSSIDEKHQQASDEAWQSYADVVRNREIEETWTTDLQWMQYVHEAEKKELRSRLMAEAINTGLADRHKVASSRSWDAYKADIQDTEAEEEWSIYIPWIQFLHQSEKARLRTEIYTAESINQAQGTELQNLQDDAQAMKKEKDELANHLVKRDERLQYMTGRRNEINNIAKEFRKENENTRKENESLLKELEVWKQRTTEAMTMAEDLREDLDRTQAECNMLTANIPSADAIVTIMRKNREIQSLQAANQGLEEQGAELRKALQFNWDRIFEKDEEMKKLRWELRSAAIEVGYIHRLNMNYRYDTEDHPERSAHLDGLLKRKDEVYDDLLNRYNKVAKQRANEEKSRSVDREHFSGVLLGLRQEIKDLENKVEGLEESRDRHQMQNEEICAKFTGKIFKADMVDAMNAQYEILKADNAYLIKMLRSREVHVEETMARIGPLNARIVELEHALETSKCKQGGLQAEVNGLETRKCDLEVALQTMEGDLEQKNRELAAELQEEKQRLNNLINDSTSSSGQLYLDCKEREIERLRAEIRKLIDNRWAWYNRAKELRPDFDPIIFDGGLGNWDSELKEQRLRIAEKMLTDLEARLRERGIWEEIRGEVDPRQRQLDEVEAMIDRL